MRLKRIIYITRLTIPKKGPRSIQVLKNCVALAEQNIEVVLYVKRNRFLNMESLSQYYGFQIPQGLHIKALPPLLRFSPVLITLFLCIKTILDRKGTSFYVRDFTLAKNIIKLKWLHKIPVFFETHCIPHIYGERIMLVNKERMGWGKSKSEEFIHKNSDGLICTFKETKEFLLNNHFRTPIVCAWHGTNPDSNFNYSFSSRNGIYYIGSFSQTKYRIETLLEAMKYVETEKLILIGGYREEDILRIKYQARDLRVLEKVEFKGYVPPGETKNYLSSAKVVVALLWGLKLSDYLSNGLPIIVPDMAIGKEVFRDGENCIMFQLNDAASLAGAINQVLNNPTFAEKLAKNAFLEAKKYSWSNRAKKIIDFINNNIS